MLPFFNVLFVAVFAMDIRLLLFIIKFKELEEEQEEREQQEQEEVKEEEGGQGVLYSYPHQKLLSSNYILKSV